MKKRFSYNTITKHYIKFMADQYSKSQIIDTKDYKKLTDFMFYLEAIMEAM